jgi:Protein of unknown function (DUF2752)
MRFFIEKAGRRIGFDRAPMIALAVWLGLLVATVSASAAMNRPVVLCSFRKLTGLPCPSCGATRGVLRILHGELVGGFLMNPLVMVVLAILAAGFALRLTFGLKPRLEVNRREKWVLISVGIALLLANWAFVLYLHFA